MTGLQLFWTVLLVLNVVTYWLYPNPASFATAALAVVCIALNRRRVIGKTE